MDKGDQYVSCPFNRHHRVPVARLQHHIIKCMPNYPNHVQCVYNGLHWFESKEEMLEHAKTCPSQILVIRDQMSAPIKPQASLPPEPRKGVHEDENWDDEYY